MPERNRGYLRKQRLRNIERRKKLISQRELMYHGYKTLNDPDFKEGMLHKGHSGRLGMGGTAVKTNTRKGHASYRHKGAYGPVDNYSRHDKQQVEDGAQKTKNRRLRFQLFSKASPSEAKATGRKIDLRSDWEEVKDKVMYEIVLAKFTQNPDLKEKLLATGNEHLEEGNTWGDTTWGTVNGIGENRLGRILMKVRKKLQEESK